MPKGRKITPAGVVKESSDVIAEREKARVRHQNYLEQPSDEKKSLEEKEQKSPKKPSKNR